ncbi:MAG: hypothetical protein ACYDEX_09400 [Mobilitalea sp.]
MKRLIGVIVILVALSSICACNNNKTATTYIGVNAEILELSNQVKGMVVKGLDNNSILGEKCYINCENKKTYFIEVVNGEPVNITFKDLSVGDMITIDIKKVEDKYASTSRVQLLERTN